MGDRYRELASDAIRVPQDGKPEALLSWVRLPDGNIRLYASRDLPAPGWGQRTTEGGTADWHIEATLRSVLIVDRPTAAEAMTWVLERWAREDAASAELEARRAEICGQPEAAELASRRRLDQHRTWGEVVRPSGPEGFIKGLPGI
jgi:hypothetical protein